MAVPYTMNFSLTGCLKKYLLHTNIWSGWTGYDNKFPPSALRKSRWPTRLESRRKTGKLNSPSFLKPEFET